MKLTVNLEKDSYPIYIENNILSQAGDYIRKIYHGKRIMIISDDNVFPLYGDRLIHTLDSTYECHHLVLPHGESTKDFQTLPTVYKAMLEAKISRSDLVIALGGGVIGDLAGFAASSYLRGVRLVQIPTSLLAQVDSSVGGKVAVDLPEGKNLVGAFYQPSLVLIDPLVLNTLKERFISDGMGEVIKYGCIKDDKFYDRLGLDENDTTILDVPVPQITIPVSAGRNLAAIVELAAMNNRQKKHGFNSAREFAAQIDGHIDRVTRENELKNQNP